MINLADNHYMPLNQQNRTYSEVGTEDILVPK
jgi:hypothetical protein